MDAYDWRWERMRRKRGGTPWIVGAGESAAQYFFELFKAKPGFCFHLYTEAVLVHICLSVSANLFTQHNIFISEIY